MSITYPRLYFGVKIIGLLKETMFSWTLMKNCNRVFHKAEHTLVSQNVFTFFLIWVPQNLAKHWDFSRWIGYFFPFTLFKNLLFLNSKFRGRRVIRYRGHSCFKERRWENGEFLQTRFATCSVPLGDDSASLSFCFLILLMLHSIAVRIK